MAARISALRPSRNGRSVRVVLDNGESFLLTRQAAADLLPGQPLEPEALRELMGESRLADAFSRCLGLLARRPRSRAEIGRYLQGRGLGAGEAAEVMRRLAAHGWIDDAKFAREWVENRQAFRPRSARALRVELHRFGVGEDDVRAALADLRETDLALAAARKRAPRLLREAEKDPQAQRAFTDKLTAHLASRGFEYSLARETARSLWDEYVRGTADADQP